VLQFAASRRTASAYAPVEPPASESRTAEESIVNCDRTFVALTVVGVLAGGCSPGFGSFDTSARELDGDGVVTSAVFGGGGSVGAPHRNDFVELFNRSELPVPLRGLSIQYGSIAGNFGSSVGNILALPVTATIAPGQYYLVALASSGVRGARCRRRI